MILVESNIFCHRLKELRLSKKLLQKDMAEELSISNRAYQYYESGNREPTINILISLADYFNVSLDYLVGRSNKPDRL